MSEQWDIACISRGLWVGAAVAEVPPGIDAIVNLTEPSEKAFRLPQGRFVRMMFAPIPDRDFPGIKWLDATVETILEWWNRGLSVLIHCTAGISRSVMVMAAVFMKLHMSTRDGALEVIARERPVLNPNRSFLMGLQQYENFLRGKS